MRPRRVAAVALIVGLAAAPSAAADTVLSIEPAAPKISAYYRTAAWSTYDASVGA